MRCHMHMHMPHADAHNLLLKCIQLTCISCTELTCLLPDCRLLFYGATLS